MSTNEALDFTAGWINARHFQYPRMRHPANDHEVPRMIFKLQYPLQGDQKILGYSKNRQKQFFIPFDMLRNVMVGGRFIFNDLRKKKKLYIEGGLMPNGNIFIDRILDSSEEPDW